MTQFKPMAFQEGVTTKIRAIGGADLTAISMDIQASGVLFEYLDGTVPTLRFYPWSNVSSIVQIVEE